MNSLIVFATLIACASASRLLYGGPTSYSTQYHTQAVAPAVVPAVYAGSYKTHHIIPQPDIIQKYARTDVVGVAPIEHGVTIKHYSAHPAGFGYSHRSYGVNGVRASDSYVAQPEHLITKTVSVAAPTLVRAAPVAYAAPGLAYGVPHAGLPLVY